MNFQNERRSFQMDPKKLSEDGFSSQSHSSSLESMPKKRTSFTECVIKTFVTFSYSTIYLFWSVGGYPIFNKEPKEFPIAF